MSNPTYFRARLSDLRPAIADSGGVPGPQGRMPALPGTVDGRRFDQRPLRRREAANALLRRADELLETISQRRPQPR